MSLQMMSKTAPEGTRPTRTLPRLFEAFRLLPANRVRAGSPVHPSLRHLAADPELHRF